MKGRRAEAAGDAAHVWHLLDRWLPVLREARDDLENAGLEELAEGLGGPIKEVEARYAKAVREVAVLLDGEER